MGMREDEMVGWHHRHDGHEFVGSGCWWGFPCGSAGKESACNVGDLGLIPGWEDPLEKEMATHSSILAWKIPWTV